MLARAVAGGLADADRDRDAKVARPNPTPHWRAPRSRVRPRATRPARSRRIRPQPASSPSASPSSSSAILPGGTQLSSVESGRRAFFRSLAQIGRQVAGGLAYAHARGIVHRDIKPSNLLLDTEGVVWITDFGLAKGDDEGLTQSGDILGTIRYMAPERFRGEGDARADVYALGLTLYELLTLRPGFDSPDRLKLIEQIKTEEPARPRAIDARIPRDLETIVLKAIEKDPKARYQSAEAMGEDLGRFLADEPIRARQVSAAERYWRWAAAQSGDRGSAAACSPACWSRRTVSSLLAAEWFHTQAETRERTASLAACSARRGRGPQQGRPGQLQPARHPGGAAPDRLRHPVQPRPGRLGRHRRRPPAQSPRPAAAARGRARPPRLGVALSLAARVTRIGSRFGPRMTVSPTWRSVPTGKPLPASSGAAASCCGTGAPGNPANDGCHDRAAGAPIWPAASVPSPSAPTAAASPGRSRREPDALRRRHGPAHAQLRGPAGRGSGAGLEPGRPDPGRGSLGTLDAGMGRPRRPLDPQGLRWTRRPGRRRRVQPRRPHASPPPASTTRSSSGTSRTRTNPLAILKGHTDEVRAVAFSPDGRRVASAGLDRTTPGLGCPIGGGARRDLGAHRCRHVAGLWAGRRDGRRRAPPTRRYASGTPPRARSFARSRGTPTRSSPWPSALTAATSPRRAATRRCESGTRPARPGPARSRAPPC